MASVEKYLEEISFNFICLATVFVPLAFWPLVFRSFSLPKVLVAYIVFSLLALVLVIRVLFLNRRIDLHGTTLFLPVYAAALFLPAFFSIENSSVLLGNYRQLGGLIGLLLMVAFSLSASAVDWSKDGRISYLIQIVLSVSLAVSVIGWLQYLFPHINGIFLFSGSQRPVYATFGNANYFGAFLSFSIPVSLVMLIMAGSKKALFLPAAAYLLSVGALAFTGSRGSWLATLIAVIAIPLVSRRLDYEIRRTAVWAILGLVIFVASSFISAGHDGQAISRPVSRISADTGTAGARLEYWRASLTAFLERPLTGWGPDTFGLVYPKFATVRSQRIEAETVTDDAHNLFLQLLVTLGIPATSLFFALHFKTYRLFFKTIRESEDQKIIGALIALAAGTFGYMIAMQSTVNSWGTSFLPWLFIGIVSSFRTDSGNKLSAGRGAGRINLFLFKAPLAGLVFILSMAGVMNITRYFSADQEFAKGYIYIDSDKKQSAAYMKGAIRKWSDNEFYLLELAKLYARSQPEKAEGYAVAASKANSSSYVPYQFLAQFYVTDGAQLTNSRFLAKQNAAKALSLFPNSEELKKLNKPAGDKQRD